MTTVINLFSGPGSGKSTLQSDLYSHMKKQGKSVEMVREVAKKWAWSKKEISPLNQLNIIGEQIKDESELYGKVDYIITDSPILLGAFYMSYNHSEDFMMRMVLDYMYFAEKNGVKFINILLKRPKNMFDTRGRFESRAEVELIDEELVEFLKNCNLQIYCENNVQLDNRFSFFNDLI
jgi:hypothetical protein